MNFKNENERRRHVDKYHVRDVREFTTNQSTVSKCSKCPASFKNRKFLREHVERYHGRPSFPTSMHVNNQRESFHENWNTGHRSKAKYQSRDQRYFNRDQISLKNRFDPLQGNF